MSARLPTAPAFGGISGHFLLFKAIEGPWNDRWHMKQGTGLNDEMTGNALRYLLKSQSHPRRPR